MKNILRLPSCQAVGNPENIRTFRIPAIPEAVKNNQFQSSRLNLEELSVARAKEALGKVLFPSKKSIQGFADFKTLKYAIKILNNDIVVNLSRDTKKFSEFCKVKAKNPEKLHFDIKLSVSGVVK